MNLCEYVQYDATGLASLLKTRQVTSGELIRLAREAHNDVNPRVNALVEFYEDAETVRGADTGFFQGVPFLRKDLGPTEAGRLQERGSRLFKGYRAPNDSVFFDLARGAGLGPSVERQYRSLANAERPKVFCMVSPVIHGTWIARQAVHPGAPQRQSLLVSLRLHMAQTGPDPYAAPQLGEGM
ncbi:hypothetical protein MPL1032_180044 [Mesorhizobium plurifarium]|uniref:Amidase n=1 Tax=Mesorhizobium plurifarium TaxID=69974 RepID=A0A0K2VTH5_MESPL|nr:hypothetical protein MPL1032_180044 [Mesorhizobium plurifarium]